MLLAHQSSLADSTLRFIFLFTVLKIPFNLKTFKNYLVKGGLFYNSKVWNDYLPGEGVYYTTQGIDLLGLLIERITKQSFSDYCQYHIFKPLKMYNTSFYFSNYTKEQLARLYVWNAGFYFKVPYIQPSNLAGGGLKTTISDFSHFLIMHTSGGMYDGVRILSKESVEEMHRVQYPGYYDDKVFLHGLGWYQTTLDNETIGGHGGNFEGARAEMKMRYSDRVGILYFWNQNSYIRMHLKQTRPEEKKAVNEIEEALFEKADEL
jgi:CubicO group peptidase (beta-lactamase class C family)